MKPSLPAGVQRWLAVSMWLAVVTWLSGWACVIIGFRIEDWKVALVGWVLVDTGRFIQGDWATETLGLIYGKLHLREAKDYAAKLAERRRISDD